MHRNRARSLLGAACCLVGLASCSDASEPQVDEPSEAPPAAAPAREVPPAITGAPVTDLPEDFPRYPGSQVSQVGGRGSMLSAVLQTPDAPEKVLAYYLDSLPSQGWSAQESSVGRERTVMADKEGRFLTIMATPEGEGTKIGMLLVQR